MLIERSLQRKKILYEVYLEYHTRYLSFPPCTRSRISGRLLRNPAGGSRAAISKVNSVLPTNGFKKRQLSSQEGRGQGPGKRMCSPIPRRSIRARGARCAASPYRRQHEDTCSRRRARVSRDWTHRQQLSSTALWSKVHRKVRTGRSPELPSFCSRCTNLGAILVHRRTS